MKKNKMRKRKPLIKSTHIAFSNCKRSLVINLSKTIFTQFVIKSDDTEMSMNLSSLQFSIEIFNAFKVRSRHITLNAYCKRMVEGEMKIN